MKKNIGTQDRLLRLGIALIVGLGILFIDSIIWQGILAFVSLFTLYEALAGWCALYSLLGKNACPVNFKDTSVEV